MTPIEQAKRSLGRELRADEGFVGVGIGAGSVIRLYAKTETAPVVQHLRKTWGASYEGFDVSIVVSPGIEAQTAL